MSESMILIAMYVVILLVLFLIIRRKSKNQSNQFDEMQLKHRAEAFKRAYFTAMVMLVGIIIFDVTSGHALEQYAVSGILIIVVMTSFLVFAVNAIWHDAYFYIGQDGKSYFWICIAVGIIHLSEFVTVLYRYFTGNDYSQNIWQLIITKVSTSAMMAITFLTLAVVIGLKQIREKRMCEE